MDKVSIVTVAFNCVNSIEKTILSVLNQKYDNLEYIIIDGNSNDGTIDIIRKYSQYITYWISEKDHGIYDAMNKGIQAATGDWIYFLNSGDVLYSENTIQNIPFSNFSNQNNVCGVIGHVKVRKLDGIVNWTYFCPFYRNHKKSYSMGFSHQGVFIKTKLAKEHLFDTSYKLCADFNQMISLHRKGYTFCECNIIISCIEGRYGTSANNRMTQFQEEAKVLGKEKTVGFKIKYLFRSIKLLLKRYL